MLLGHEKKVLENPHCVHNHGNCIYHTKVLRLYYVKQPVSSVRGSPLNNKDSSDNGPHVLHKTFHIPAVMVPSTVKLNGDQRALLPLHHMEDTMAKVRRWISMTGKHMNEQNQNHFNDKSKFVQYYLNEPVIFNLSEFRGCDCAPTEPCEAAFLPEGSAHQSISMILYLFCSAGVKVTGVETIKLISHHTRDNISAENTHFESGGLRNTCIVYALRLYIQDEAGSLSKKDLNPDPKNVKLFDHHCCIL